MDAFDRRMVWVERFAACMVKAGADADVERIRSLALGLYSSLQANSPEEVASEYAQLAFRDHAPRAAVHKQKP